MTTEAQQGAPKGWRLVPEELTEAMEAAWCNCNTFESAYRAMLDASPAPPASGDVEPAGEVASMVGSNGGFTMAVFKASDVPVGTKLYTAPIATPPAPAGAVSDAQTGQGEIVGKEFRIVLQNAEGRFFEAGFDAPDRWLHGAFQAGNRDGLAYLRDANYGGAVGGRLVEIEVTARLTGLDQSALYKDGELVSDEERDAARAALQSPPPQSAPQGDASALEGAMTEALIWPEAQVTNPDIGQETGIPYIDCLLHRLLDAQQDINLSANEQMDQRLSEASELLSEVETALRKFASVAHPTAAESRIAQAERQSEGEWQVKALRDALRFAKGSYPLGVSGGIKNYELRATLCDAIAKAELRSRADTLSRTAAGGEVES